MKAPDTLSPDRLCECGYRVKWSTWADADDFDRQLYPDAERVPRLHWDVVERPCPHGNGTIIQFCPSCDRKVGMWGCGPAGGMECDCWSRP